MPVLWLGAGAVRTIISKEEKAMMDERDRLLAAREAWKEGRLYELRRIFGDMDLDLDDIMENTFREYLCAGKNFE